MTGGILPIIKFSTYPMPLPLYDELATLITNDDLSGIKQFLSSNDCSIYTKVGLIGIVLPTLVPLKMDTWTVFVTW